MEPEKSSILGPADNLSEIAITSTAAAPPISNPNLLKKIFKKGAQQLNLTYQQEFIVNFS
jgi:hypothetical protein